MTQCPPVCSVVACHFLVNICNFDRIITTPCSSVSVSQATVTVVSFHFVRRISSAKKSMAAKIPCCFRLLRSNSGESAVLSDGAATAEVVG